MTSEVFWKVRSELYAQPSGDPTYFCRGCDHELGVRHADDCPVAWFEATFYDPSFQPKGI